MPWRSIMHHAATHSPPDPPFLPFQDLYARFASRLAKNRWMGEKSEGVDATELLLRSFELLF